MDSSSLKTQSFIDHSHRMTLTTSMMDGSTSTMRYSVTQLELKELFHLPQPRLKKSLSLSTSTLAECTQTVARPKQLRVFFMLKVVTNSCLELCFQTNMGGLV